MLLRSVSPKSAFIPRKSPSPSSPTSATKVTVPGVRTPAWFIERTMATSTARPRQLSPMPGPEPLPAPGDLDVGVFGEDGVEVRGYHEMGTQGFAGTIAEHVARLDRRERSAGRAARITFQHFAAGRFLERRRQRLRRSEPDRRESGVRCFSRPSARHGRRRPASVTESTEGCCAASGVASARHRIVRL